MPRKVSIVSEPTRSLTERVISCSSKDPYAIFQCPDEKDIATTQDAGLSPCNPDEIVSSITNEATLSSYCNTASTANLVDFPVFGKHVASRDRLFTES